MPLRWGVAVACVVLIDLFRYPGGPSRAVRIRAKDGREVRWKVKKRVTAPLQGAEKIISPLLALFLIEICRAGRP